MYRIKATESFWVESEPGDGTHYEFVVSTIPDRDDALFVSSVARGQGCPTFIGYAYNLIDLDQFAKDWRKVFAADRDTYRDTVRTAGGHHLIDYAVEHSHANPWTALAALITAKRVADLLRGRADEGRRRS